MSEYNDRCKHIAGLLILWNRSPQEFTQLDTWQTLLKNKSKDDLLRLITSAVSKSIDMTNALYEELGHESLIDYEEMYDSEDEW